MLVSYASNIGKIRKNNEDSIIVDTHNRYMIIADGMGGHNAGEVASSICVNIISDYLNCNLSESNSNTQIEEIIKKAVSIANDVIQTKSKEISDLQGMGTTVTVVIFHKNLIFFSNIGDSRLYLIRNSKITQLTEDDSVVSRLLMLGEISKEQAVNHPLKHLITKAIGTSENIHSEVESISFNQDDFYLMCTDGLTDLVSDKEIENIFNTNKNADLICKKLIDKALYNGGIDNISIIIIFINNLIPKNG